MEEISVHESVREMYQRIKSDGLTNVFDRFDVQEPTRCPYCSGGISCQLCSNGPCRITKKADRGVCGIDANGMAMRTMLLRNVMGTSTYTYHAVEVAKTLKAAAEGKTLFKIKDGEKLRKVAGSLEVDVSGGKEDIALRLADFLLKEIYLPLGEPSRITELLAPQARKRLWKELGIFPGGPASEMMMALSSCLTNVDGDYVSLAKKAMRLGISCIYGSQIGLELCQDVLFGTPMPHEVEVDLGILDKDYVNIVPDGHEPFVGAALIEVARRKEFQKEAREAGAKGIHIVGNIETGQELIQRFPQDEVFVGLAGNWLSMEPLLATGSIDLFAADMNCTLPTLGLYAERYGTTMVSVSPLVNIPGLARHMDYLPEEVETQAEDLIRLAIENFKKRKGKETHIPLKKEKAIVGISTEAVLKVLGGSLDPLLEAIKNGSIKGVVALVSCTTLKNGPQDAITLSVAKELIKRDILVLSAGCGNAACQVGGLTNISAQELAGERLEAVCKKLQIPPVLSFGTCTDTGRLSMVVTEVANALGVDTSDLPVAVTAPEYMEQKATIDALFALAFGLYTHVSPVPPVTGAPELVKLLTEDLEGITGGKLAVQTNPVEAVDAIEAHIMKKRAKLGIA